MGMAVACARYTVYAHAEQAAAQEDCDRFCDDKEALFRRMAGETLCILSDYSVIHHIASRCANLVSSSTSTVIVPSRRSVKQELSKSITAST